MTYKRALGCFAAAVSSVVMTAASSAPAADMSALSAVKVGSGRCSGDPFGIADYDRLQRISELALSGDGQAVIYAVEPFTTGFSAVSGKEKIYWQSLKRRSPPILLPISDAKAITWLPDNRHIAFLSMRSGSSQVYRFELATHRVEQSTFAQDAVQDFEYSPDGTKLVYRTMAQPARHVSFYQRLKAGTSAVVVNPADDISMYDFVNPLWDAAVRPGASRAWVQVASEHARELPVAGDARQLHWAPDGHAISVVFVAAGIAPGVFHDDRTSIAVLQFPGLTTMIAADARQDARSIFTAYRGGEWYPDGHSILLRRVEFRDPWVSNSVPDWARISILGANLATASWHNITSYPGRSRFFPQADGTFLRQDVLNADASLYRDDGKRAPARSMQIAGSSTRIVFDRRGKTMAFVNEGLERPPEVYVGRGNDFEQLTHLNHDAGLKLCYDAQEFRWTSTDGATAQGWLLTPKIGKPPYPLITLVHGGPGVAITDSFAPYFAFWPYPLEVWASHGVAIFIPNYRGTDSFGAAYATPTTLDAEPVDDVVTGVRQLVGNGTADRARLGLLGHSHGASLAPLVMARSKLFRAASFAEGAADDMTNFDLMSPSLTDLVLTPLEGKGTSMYDDVRPFARLSPNLAFGGVSTATLFEAGSDSLALQMLGFAKAAQHADMPYEYAIYPNSGHNLSDPDLIRDAATRNLRWMNFWLDLSDQNFQESASWREKRVGWKLEGVPPAGDRP